MYDAGESTPSNTVVVNIVVTSIDDEEIKATKLNGNFPNPFSTSTNISFSLKNNSHVNISIYNVNGRLVKNLVNADLSGNGKYDYSWDGTSNGKNVSNGIYYYRLETDNKTFMKKMILMK